MYSLKKKQKENTHNLNSRSNVRLYVTKLNITPNAVIGLEKKQTNKQLKMVSEKVSKKKLITGISNRSIKYLK